MFPFGKNLLKQNTSSLRRPTVFDSTNIDTTDRSPTEVHPKDSEQTRKLQVALSRVPIIAEMDEPIIHQIILAMEPRSIERNDVIIKEGDEGDYFYVIETGTYEATQLKKNKINLVTTYKEGGFFGELALLYDQPRSATITAKTDGKLWALSRNNFKKTVCRNHIARRTRYGGLIGQVEILQNLSSEEKERLSEALSIVKYPAGHEIIKQGDEADGMFFIEDGEVSINATNQSGVTVKLKSLKAGDYFGELALLTRQPRAASATAETDVTLAFLDVDSFERLLGSCDKIMRRNASTYNKQMKKLFSSSNYELRK